MHPTNQDTFRQKLADLLASPNRPGEGDHPLWEDAEAAPPVAGMLPPDDPPPRPARVAAPSVPREFPPGEFVPVAPATFEETGLGESEVEALILKYLVHSGSASGRDIAEHVKLSFRLIEGLLRRLKESMLLVYKSSAPLSDYVYELTETGHQRAGRYAQNCTYFGTAPVSLAQYVASVKAQSITLQCPKLADLRKAFGDLVLADEILGQIGQSVNSGMGLFLYGAPGNGKTSIAERIIKAFGESVWVPRAISVFGEVIRLFDPSNHEPLRDEPGSPYDQPWIDRRWIRVRRPTIVVGGELTLESLEISTNPTTGISEAPLQMKANCGTLVIDDFGRQRISVAELLNRWIVPLEKRYDFLNLANGRKIQVPFDQLIIFSTNLEPKELVDEAFLRRIPYKIDVHDPSEEQFRNLFRRLCGENGVAYREECVDYLIERYYKATGRGMRFCHPRDLLRQVHIFCRFNDRPAALSHEAIDAAVRNYFAMM